jgi:hypothetical protein
MAIQDGQLKESSYDGKGAVSGKPEPNPEKGDVNRISSSGVEPKPEEPIATQATLEQRDAERWELDPDSSAQ